MGRPSGGTGPQQEGDQPRAVVCVIDDDASMLRALRRLLGTCGFAVEVFPSAEAFLQSESPARADCLVLNVRLPRMSGVELQQHLLAAGSPIPVVFMVAHDDAVTRKQMTRAGAVDYLQKPFDDAPLIAAIIRAIGRA